MDESKSYSSLGELIDSSEEDFRKYCENQDLGYLCSLHNLLVLTYEEVKSVKNELVAKIAKGEVPSNEENEKTVEGLYAKLMKIELEVFIVREYRDRKNVPHIVYPTGSENLPQ